ncbi:pyridoxamine 5'-phosphate oxidase family protein [Halobacteriales archaeon Cl-PHB]
MPVEALSADEVDALLREHGAGVLSFTDGEESYAVPEAFGYDGDSLYFQLVYDDDSRKMAFVETTEVATFTLYTEGDPAESVVARGPLERVPESETMVASNTIAENADIPTLNVVTDAELADLSFDYYRLRPTELTGRTFGLTTN